METKRKSAAKERDFALNCKFREFKNLSKLKKMLTLINVCSFEKLEFCTEQYSREEAQLSLM